MQRKFGFTGAIISFLLTIVAIITFYIYENAHGHLGSGSGCYPVFVLYAILLILIVGGIISIGFLTTSFATYNNSKPIQNVHVNNNPFLPSGRIEQHTYIATIIVIIFLSLIIDGILFVLQNSNIYPLIHKISDIFVLLIFIVALSSISKRLRDVKWPQLFLIIAIIPYVNIILCITLLFIKSEYNDN